MKSMCCAYLLFILSAISVYGQQDSLLKVVLDKDELLKEPELIDRYAYDLIEDYPAKIPELAKVVEKIANEQDNDKYHALSQYFMGRHYFHLGQTDSAFILYHQALDYFKGQGSSLELARIYNSMSRFWYEKGDLNKQLLYNDSALDVCEKAGKLDNFKLTLLNNRANILDRLGRPEETKQILRNIYRQLDHSDDVHFKVVVALNLTRIFDITGNLDSALYFALWAQDVAEAGRDIVSKARANMYVGGIYVKMNRTDLARQYLGKAIKLYEVSGDMYDKVYCQLIAAEAELAAGNDKAALQFADSAMVNAGKAGYFNHVIHVYELKSRLYESIGSYDRALDFYKRSIVLKDSLNNEVMNTRIAEIEMEHQAKEREQELLVLRKDQEIKTREHYFLYLLLVAVVILLALIVVYYRSKQKIQEKEKQKLEAEVEQRNLEEKQLKAELDLKRRQLTSKALHISERNELLQQLLDKIKRALAGNEAQRLETLQSLRRLINMNMRNQSEWQEFRRYFEEINEDFIHELRSLNGDLTEKEIRLLALTKLGLNTKEIAHLMHVAPNSVKMARYRLKKKLTLDDEASIEQFVQNM